MANLTPVEALPGLKLLRTQMAKSLPDSTELSESISIKTEKVASRWLGPFRGMTTPSHHKCAAVPPPIRAAGAGAKSIRPTTLDAVGSSILLARLAHSTPMAARPCCNWFMTSSALEAKALGDM